MAKVITTELQHAGASAANITLDSSKNVTCENNLTVDGTTTLTGAVELPDDTVDIADLSATGTASSSTFLRGDNSWAAPGGGLFASYAILEDQKSAGTEGGSATLGSWQTRDLNTEVSDPDGIVSISSNQFTIGPGSFLIQWRNCSYQTGRHQTRLYNVTDSSVGGYAQSHYIAQAGVTTFSYGHARVTISSGTKSYRIEHRVSITEANTGYGVAFSDGGTQVFSQVLIYKEA